MMKLLVHLVAPVSDRKATLLVESVVEQVVARQTVKLPAGQVAVLFDRMVQIERQMVQFPVVPA